ncbi:MoxR family ATPase [Cyanobium sp. Morenito 9A2]|uniref:AAA family ATPase n=1 Tax=Cyanobium sp. Morenito 9A2 TaxID=2823718 RepID=UPI0020CD3E12|nr:MoxR family ATPase [Cyanobium sp. Morenito 9A2]MCP9850011.1 AAA family ATPase [Cyanobium sp. Morenito 9A2]
MTSLVSVVAQISRVLLGKERQVRLAVSGLVAGGHLLFEDLPGMGKTTLAEALARSFDLDFRRVHFTSDLLPADLTGIRLFDQNQGAFRFEPGPLFAQVLLADEINRASPRTQSALLEAMAAGRVSVDGTSHPLPQPFFVIATQNGLDQSGTAPLPESQLDRFLMRLSLGFPDREAERALLAGEGLALAELHALLSPQQLLEEQQRCRQQHASAALLDYVLDLVAQSRQAGPGTGTLAGNGAALSPRAAQALLQAGRAWSLIEGRDFVKPDDIQAVFAAVCEHRLDGGAPQGAEDALCRPLLEAVDGLR